MLGGTIQGAILAFKGGNSIDSRNTKDNLYLYQPTYYWIQSQRACFLTFCFNAFSAVVGIRNGHKLIHKLKFMMNLVHDSWSQVDGRATDINFPQTFKLFVELRASLWVETFLDRLALLNQNVYKMSKKQLGGYVEVHLGEVPYDFDVSSLHRINSTCSWISFWKV